MGHQKAQYGVKYDAINKINIWEAWVIEANNFFPGGPCIETNNTCDLDHTFPVGNWVIMNWAGLKMCSLKWSYRVVYSFVVKNLAECYMWLQL